MKNKYNFTLKLILLIAIIAGLSVNLSAQNAWINEIHYDDGGADANETIEIIIENPVNYNLSLFQVVLYNGNGGANYDTRSLSTYIVGAIEGNFTFYSFNYTVALASIQNGAPDGLALVYDGTVIPGQFLSYEGTFLATNGPAIAMTSVDINVSETGSEVDGLSLQLSGSGAQYSDFAWQAPATATTGNLNNGQALISGGVSNPANFNALTISTSQIDLSWTLNGSGDSVLIAQNTTNSFGTPSGVYNVGGSIGSSTVIYKGNGTTTSQTSLIIGTEYFYTAWSFTADHEYSLGVSDSAATLKDEPSNYPAGFTATAYGLTLTLTWDDATGSSIPDGYLVMINTEDNFTVPVDGIVVADDLITSDGTGKYNVAAGAETCTFYLLDETTVYYAVIYPYTNSGDDIIYKTDGTAPSDNDETQSVINANDFADNTFGTWDTTSVASNKNWTLSTGSGPYGTSGYANINGFGGNVNSNDWLISPALNLQLFTNDKMHFFTSWTFTGPDDEMKLKYSTDYAGDPVTATWTELTFTRPAALQTWTPSGIIDLSGITGSTVYLAFHYVSGGITGGTTRSVSVDEIEITGDGVSNPTGFDATVVSSTQIDLAWEKNNSNNDVMLAWNSINQFGTPMGTYTEGGSIIGGGTILYIGQNEFYNHTGRTAGTLYYYKAWSKDLSNLYSSGVADSATTQFAEPTSHPTGIKAESNGPTQITVSWTDSDAAHYLIKGSPVGYSSIIPPIDGEGQSDSLLVKNVDASILSHQFTGLTPNTQYYFKIWPYNGGGESSNYKTDGTISEATAITEELDIDLIISEVADPIQFDMRFVELYNTGTTTIDFTNDIVYFCRQSNGGPESWASVQLTGTLPAGETYIIAFQSTTFDTAYSITADIYSSTTVNNNGDDGVFLYYGGNQTTGYMFDAYGVINEDGTGKPWLYEDGHAVRKRTVTSPSNAWTNGEWAIVRNINYKNMTPDMHAADVTWQGTTSTGWNTRGNNWSGLYGWVPDASCIVTIPNVTNYPIVTEPSASHQVIIQSGSTLSVQSTGSLLIVGP